MLLQPLQTLTCNNLFLLTGCYRCEGKGHTPHVCPSQVRDDELQGKGCIRGDYVTVRAIQ